MNFDIETLGKHHDRDSFDCGEPSLNDYLKLFARQNDSRGLGKTFVAVLPNETIVKGYYTVSSSSISFETLPENLPRYPIPVVHLGRLAVDHSARGTGLGGILLIDALLRADRLADQLGIYAVEVRALNAAARNFYLRYGFEPLSDDELHLYMTIKTIRKLF